MTSKGPVVRVMVAMGTRPEGIKLAPVIQQLSTRSETEVIVCLTGQHREMLYQVTQVFGIRPDLEVDLFQHGQSLPSLTARSVDRLSRVVKEVRPDVIVVQGDTTSTLGAALAGFYNDVPVIHVEAGLRTNDLRSPYPEEMNRRLVTRLASLHLAPTCRNRENLVQEGIHKDDIIVTGNTVIDALLWAVRAPAPDLPLELREQLGHDRPILLVTAHRRESWGPRMRSVGAAIDHLARENPDWLIVFPIHRNPMVRRDVSSTLGSWANVLLLEPLAYLAFAHLLSRARIVVTDSGGLQEEAPSLGKPVLVLRDSTERPEAVAAGTARLVGTAQAEIIKQAQTLIDDDETYQRMARATNPYGDGHSADRVVAALHWRYLGGPRPTEFGVD